MTSRTPSEHAGPSPENDWDWKHTIIVFGRDDMPGIDELEAAERAAVAILKGYRSLGRGGISAKSTYSPPSAYVDECDHCGQRASAHKGRYLACPNSESGGAQ